MMQAINFQLDDKHIAALDELTESLSTTRAAVMRQALRLYLLAYHRAGEGEQLAFTKDGLTTPVIVLDVLDVLALNSK